MDRIFTDDDARHDELAKPKLRVYLTFEGGNPEPYEVESVDIWDDVKLSLLFAGGLRITPVQEESSDA